MLVPIASPGCFYGLRIGSWVDDRKWCRRGAFQWCSMVVIRLAYATLPSNDQRPSYWRSGSNQLRWWWSNDEAPPAVNKASVAREASGSATPVPKR